LHPNETEATAADGFFGVGSAMGTGSDMSKLIGSRFVLAVKNLAASKAFYCDVLGFVEEPIRADGWAFLRRDDVAVSLGECPDGPAASEIGDHSYMAYLLVDDARGLCEAIRNQGGAILSDVADKPWGMREFLIRTIDGHRICFGQER
jgi:catechol 2,3-dioxygenase-like lactoylglutathione lyase family enzyme